MEAGRGRRAGERSELVDVGALLDDAAEAWRPLAVAFGASLAVEPLRGRALVRADPVRLAQACGNLVANAVEHGASPVRVRGRVLAGRVRVEVTTRARACPLPVSRLVGAARAPRRRRAGAGLAIAARIAERHGGRLAAAPSARGACLVLELPSADRAPWPAGASPSPFGAEPVRSDGAALRPRSADDAAPPRRAADRARAGARRPRRVRRRPPRGGGPGSARAARRRGGGRPRPAAAAAAAARRPRAAAHPRALRAGRGGIRAGGGARPSPGGGRAARRVPRRGPARGRVGAAAGAHPPRRARRRGRRRRLGRSSWSPGRRSTSSSCRSAAARGSRSPAPRCSPRARSPAPTAPTAPPASPRPCASAPRQALALASLEAGAREVRLLARTG